MDGRTQPKGGRWSSSGDVMRSPAPPSRSFMCAGLVALVITLSAAAGTDGESSLEHPTEDVSARLSQAIEQDDAEMVLRLLPGLNATEDEVRVKRRQVRPSSDPVPADVGLAAVALRRALAVAASLDSHKVIAALLESSAPTRHLTGDGHHHGAWHLLWGT